MAFASNTILFALFGSLPALVLPVLLEVFLATRQNKWVGLILPILSAAADLALFALVLFNLIGGTGAVTALLLFGALTLIPPTVLFLTYWLCRRWLARKTAADEMTQMNIQDL